VGPYAEEGQQAMDLVRHERYNPPDYWVSRGRSQSSHIERSNNTLRQRVSRLVRETLSFSEKLANHIGAIKYFICCYNLTKTTALPA
jgi:deferrochelatase/peroxidase EfeB